MRTMIITLFTAVYGTVALSSPLYVSDIRELLPSNQELKNWAQTDSASIYTGEDLFTMINGGADIYLEYGFVQAVTADYSNQKQTMTAEIYEMSDESSAFGIYSVSKSRNGIIFAGDCEAQLNPMYALFYKDRYFGIISCGDSSAVSMNGLKDMIRFISGKIQSPCEKPLPLNYLPRQGLKDVRLVRGYIGLSTIVTFDTRDIFRSKQAVIGFYDSSEVFIFCYQSEEESADIFRSLIKSFLFNDRFTELTDHRSYFEMKNRYGDMIAGTINQNHVIIIQSRNRNDYLSVFTSIRLLMRK